jgi:hypothetical protein
MKKKNPRRAGNLLPPPSPSLFVFFTKLQLEREEKGEEWCREHGAGGLLRMLGLPDPSVTPRNAVARDRHALSTLVVLFCAACPHTDCPRHPDIGATPLSFSAARH